MVSRLCQLQTFATCLLLVGAWGLFALSDVVISLASAQAPTGEAPALRRIYVPAERPEVWPTGGERFLPIKASRLQQLLKAAAKQQATAALVERIDLQFTQRPDGQLAGTLAMKITTPAGGAFLPWPEPSLSISNPRWQPQLPVDDTQVAQLGNWLDATQATRYGLAVPSSGTFYAEVSLPGFVAERATNSIAFELPPALHRQLQFELPTTARPITPLKATTLQTPATLADNDEPADPSEPPAERSSWTLQLAPGTKWQFTIDQTDAGPASPLGLQASSETTYQIDASGIAMQTAWRLSPSSDRSLPETLTILLPAGVTGAEFRFAGQPLAARQALLAPQASAPTVVPWVVDLANVSPSSAAVLELSAWSPVDLDSLCLLPLAQIANALWTEGTVKVVLSPSVVLADLPSMTGAVRLPKLDATTANLAFQLIQPDADLGLSLKLATPALSASIERRCELADDLQRASFTIAVNQVQGVRPAELAFDLQRDWTIASVTARPRTLIERWTVEAVKDRPTQRRLHIELAAGLNTQALVGTSLTVTARRPALAIGKSQPIRDFLVLHPADASFAWQVTQQTLQLESPEPYSLVTAQLNRSLLANSSVEEETTPEPSGESLAGNQSADRLRLDLSGVQAIEKLGTATLKLANQPTQFDATVAIAAHKLATHTDYRMRADLQSSRSLPAELLLLFDMAIPESAVWFDPETQALLTAEPLGQSGVRSDRTAWQVTLREGSPRVSLAMSCRLPAEEPLRIPLAGVAMADNQRGSVQLSGLQVTSKWIDHPGITPVPVENTSQTPTPQFAYQYDPQALVVPRRALLLGIRSGAPSPDEPALLLQAVKTTLLTATKPSASHAVRLHEATYQTLQTVQALPSGSASSGDSMDQEPFEFRLPSGARFEGVWSQVGTLPGTPIEASIVSDPLGDLVRVPAGQASTFSLRYQTTGPALGNRRQVLPSLPSCRATMPAAWQWRLVVPMRYRLLDSRSVGKTGSLAWQQRLFGFLASPSLASNAQNDSQPTTTLQGWKTISLTLSSQPKELARSTDFIIRLVDQDNRDASLIGLAMVVMTVAAWLLAAGGWQIIRWLLVAGCLLMALCLVLPTEMSAWATASWLGLLFALPCAWLVRKVTSFRLSTPVAADAPTATMATRPMIGRLLLIALLSSASTATAQTTNNAAQPLAAKPVAEKVLIPIDSDRQPTGDKHYLSEAYLRRLLQAEARESRALPAATVIRRIDYQGALKSNGTNGSAETTGTTPGQLTPTNWSISLDITTFRRDAAIRLPLHQNEASWSTFAVVDGVPRPLVWDAAGQSCSFTIAEPGDRRVRLSFEPKITQTDGESCLQLSIPPIANSQLRVDYPEQHPDVRTPLATATRSRWEDQARLTATLSNQSQLLVCWTQDQTQMLGETLSVDLMQWLRVTPTGVFVEIQIRGTTSNEDLSSVAIKAPDDWRRIDQQATQASAQPKDDAAAPSTNANPLPKRVLNAAYQLPRQSSLGVVAAPAATAVGAKVQSRLVAISVDESYTWSLQSAGNLNAIEREEFTNRWSEDDSVRPEINQALLLPDDQTPELAQGQSPQPRWSVRIAPTNAAEIVPSQQTCVVAVGPKEIISRFAAQLPAGRPEAPAGRSLGPAGRLVGGGLPAEQSYGHALRLPPGLVVEQVRCVLTSEATGRQNAPQLVPARWSRTSDSRGVLLFDRPTSAPHRVEIVGRMPRPTDSTFALPTIGLATSDLDDNLPLLVELYRDPSLLVDLPNAALNRSPNLGGGSPARPPGSDAIFVGSFADAPTLNTVTVTNNQLSRQIESVTTYTRTEEQITATWFAKVSIERGQLDRLTFELPPSMVDELELVRPAGAMLQAPPFVGTTGGEVRLAEPLKAGESVMIEIRAAISGELQQISPPVLFQLTDPSLPNNSVASFVALPPLDTSGNGRWRLPAYRRRDIPKQLAAELPSRIDWRTYRYVGPDTSEDSLIWQADTKQTGRTEPAASHLQLTISPQGEANLVSQIILQPQGEQAFRLRIPARQQLQLLRIDGQPPLRMSDPSAVTDEQTSNGKGVAKIVDVALISPTQPQLLTIVTNWQVRRDKQRWQWPTLVDQEGDPLPCRSITGTISTGNNWHALVPEDITENAQRTWFNQLAAAGETVLKPSTIETTSNPTQSEIAWAHQLLQASAPLEETEKTTNEATAEPSPLLQRAQTLVNQPGLPARTITALLQSPSVGSQVIPFEIPAGLSEPLELLPATADDRFRRSAGALVLTLLGVALLRWPNRQLIEKVTSAIHRGPIVAAQLLLLAIVGAGWWRWLSPREFGLVLIAMALVISVIKLVILTRQRFAK